MSHFLQEYKYRYGPCMTQNVLLQKQQGLSIETELEIKNTKIAFMMTEVI